MDIKTFLGTTEDMMSICVNKLFSKNKEYASKRDVFNAFNEASGLTGKNRKNALCGMWLKHIVSIFDMAKSNKVYPDDVWEEKISDSINYLLLLYGMVKEESEERTDED